MTREELKALAQALFDGIDLKVWNSTLELSEEDRAVYCEIFDELLKAKRPPDYIPKPGRIYVLPNLAWCSEQEYKDNMIDWGDNYEVVDVPDGIEDVNAWLAERERSFLAERVPALYPD
jgi:hypothetical protein